MHEKHEIKPAAVTTRPRTHTAPPTHTHARTHTHTHTFSNLCHMFLKICNLFQGTTLNINIVQLKYDDVKCQT